MMGGPPNFDIIGPGSSIVGGGGSISDATSTSKGAVQLTGDLGGTADAPTTPTAAKKAANLSDLSDVEAAKFNLNVQVFTAKVAATTNLALSGLAAIDGFTPSITGTLSNGVAGPDLVLATGQTTASQNGLWAVSSGAWTRPSRFPSGGVVSRSCEVTIGGGSNPGTVWVLAVTTAITIDTTAQPWVLQPIPASALPPSVVIESDIIAGNLGATYTLAMGAFKLVRLFGTLNANCAVTTSGWPSGVSHADLILSQDATGSRTLTINGTAVTGIPSVANAAFTVTLDTSDGGATIRVGVPAASGPAGADQTANVPVNAQAANYTLVATDKGKSVDVSALATITLPPAVFAVGDVGEIVRTGAGAVTIGLGAGVTSPNFLEAAGTTPRTVAHQYGVTGWRYLGGNAYLLIGDLA